MDRKKRKFDQKVPLKDSNVIESKYKNPYSGPNACGSTMVELWKREKNEVP